MLKIERFVCNPIRENTYVVSDETNECVIVDCGAYFPEERKAGLKVEAHENESQLMESLPEQAESFCHIELDYEMPAVGRYLSGNDVIEFGNHKFTILETPGHSPGGVFYYCKEEAVAFSGDTLFQGSVGRTDLKGGSMFLLIQSLRMISQLPDETKILPGHGEPTTIGDEETSNPYLDR